MAAVLVLAVFAVLLPSVGSAAGLPSGERNHGNVSVEPAYNDFDGSIVYLQTPERLAPLNPTNPIGHVNQSAVAPLYLIVYPPGTPGTFNCMGDPGNCPDHDPTIAGVAVSTFPTVYGSVPEAVPGHDHLVGMPRTGDFNVAWRVYIDLFTPGAAVTHITTLSALNAAKTAGSLSEIDTGIQFVCSVVSEQAYQAGTPA
ncbi:MAG TPA: hypothetical protein VFJ24_09670 [Gaiellales bacterium]|nr:hypothetical protein [Gaiellales bacterium]